MSRVFLATETGLGRRVVIKVLPPDFAAGVSAERFRREIVVAARLQHPHIVPLLEVGTDTDLLAFSMPYVEGESLRERMTRESGLPVGDAVRLWREILDALSYAHARGVVHRDIKPENILLSGKHAVVTDFGVARAVTAATGGARMTRTGVTIGTPAYMAPEQAAGDPQTDHRADIYASALVMWELLAGRHPFAGLTPTQLMAAQIGTMPPRVSAVRTSVPPALAELVERCLAKHPADRPATANDVIMALDAIPVTSEARTEAPGVPTSGRSRLSKKHLGGIAAIVVVAAFASVWGVRARQRLLRASVAGDTVGRAVALIPVEIGAADSAAAFAMVRLVAVELDSMPSVRTLYADAAFRDYARRVWGVDPATVAQPDTLQFLARRLGVHAKVLLGVVRIGTGVTLTARLLAVRDDRVFGVYRESAADSGQLLAAYMRLARDIRARLADTLRMLQRSDDASVYSSRSLEALSAIRNAAAKYSSGDNLAAIADYRVAVQLDPTFAYGYQMLANGLHNVGLHHAEMLDAYTRSMQLAEHARPIEQWDIRSLYYWSRGELDSALAVYAERMAATPTSRAPLNNMGIAHTGVREFAAAEQLFRRAMGDGRRPGVSFGNLERALLVEGKIASAESLAAVPAVAGTIVGAEMRRNLHIAQRKFDDVGIDLRTMAGPADTSFNERLERARVQVALLRTRGRIRGADSASRSLEALYVEFGDPGSALREASNRARTHSEILGDAAGGRVILDGALRAYPLKDMAVLDRPYAELAEAAVSVGQADRGGAWLSEYAAQLPRGYEHADSNASDRAQAAVDAARGAPVSALQHARKADAGECLACGAATVARTFEAAHTTDSTIATWARYLSQPDPRRLVADQFSLARALKQLGELYETKGDREKALSRYNELLELWKDADPELQPLMTDLKQRVARLTAKSG